MSGGRAVPGEPAPGGGQVAAQRARREHGERDQERSRLAADEQQPSPGDGRVALGLAQLLGRQRQRPRDRARLEGGPGAIGLRDEPVDLPQSRRAARERLHPAVAAVGPRENRRRDEPRDALRDDERAGRRPVVPRRFGERGRELGVGERVVGRSQEVAEELARAKCRRPDLDDPQPRGIREAAAASEPEHLAALGSTRARESPRAEENVRTEPVDGGKTHERSRDRALPDERDPRRTGSREPLELRGRGHVEPLPRLFRPRRHAEPGRTHGARVGGEALHVLRDAAILGDRPADEHARQHRGGRSDPERRTERPGPPTREPAERERDDEASAGHVASSCRRRYARAFSRPPQTCIEHQFDERLRELS